MFGLFKKKRSFDDTQKAKFVRAISDMLEIQKMVVSKCSIEDGEGCLNRKAIGYVYGFIDAALQSIGHDMSDISIGIPITYQVLDSLFPGRANEYTQFLMDHMGEDPEVTLGAQTGGQQYIEFTKPGTQGAPMGFARFMLEGTKDQ